MRTRTLLAIAAALALASCAAPERDELLPCELPPFGVVVPWDETCPGGRD